MAQLPRPPKFQPQAGPPETLADWLVFWRWLLHMYAAAQDGEDALVLASLAADSTNLLSITEELRRLISAGDSGSTAGSRLDDLESLIAAGDALPAVGARLDDLEKLIWTMIEATTPPLVVVQIASTAVADTLIADPGALVALGQEVEYQITQNAVDGWIITWVAAFKGAGPLTVGRVALRMNVVRFRRLSFGLVLLFSVGDIAP